MIWSWPTIFITLLSDDFDVISQNFFRYSAGTVFLLLCTLIFWRRGFLAARKNLHRFLLPAILVFLFQIVWVEAIYRTTPTTSILLSKLDIIFIAGLCALFFNAERIVVTNRYFIAGAVLALIGVAGFVLGKGEGVGTEFNFGVSLLLLRSLIWGCYTVSIRSLVHKLEPIVIATWVFLLADLFFLPTILLWGDIHRVVEVSTGTNILLFGSGALCVGLGNALNYTSIKRLGATVTSTLLLLTPFIGGILAYFVCDETLTASQIVSGAVIVFGCWVIVRKVIAQGNSD